MPITFGRHIQYPSDFIGEQTFFARFYIINFVNLSTESMKKQLYKPGMFQMDQVYRTSAYRTL